MRGLPEPSPPFWSAAAKKGILGDTTSLGLVAFLRAKSLVYRQRTVAGMVSPPIHSAAFIISSDEQAHIFDCFPLASEVPEVVAALTGKACRRYGPEYPATLEQMRRRRVVAGNIAKWNALQWATLTRFPARADPTYKVPPPSTTRLPLVGDGQRAEHQTHDHIQPQQARDMLTHWLAARARLWPRESTSERAQVFAQIIWPARADLRQQLLDMIQIDMLQTSRQGDPTHAGRPATQ
jgi:hypothetical protein